jgi:hypothetical protein
MSAEEAEKWRNRAKPGMPLFDGPSDIREAFILAKGIDWTASYIDPATWLQASRAIVCRTHVAFDRINQQASFLCERLGIHIRRPVAQPHRMAAE